MPIKYKIDILASLKTKGYSTYRIRQEGLLSQSTLQKLREGQGISWENIATICWLLDCQPGDIMEYVEEKKSPPVDGIKRTVMPWEETTQQVDSGKKRPLAPWEV